MKGKNRIVYSINVDDIQTVASEKLERLLTKEELEIVEEKLGGYLGWYEAIDLAIDEVVDEEDEDEE